MSADAEAGLAVSAHNNSLLNSSTLSNVSVLVPPVNLDNAITPSWPCHRRRQHTRTSELHITGTGNPIPGTVINLNLTNAWLFFDNIIPSTVASSFLGSVRVNGAPAVLNSNVRVVEYGAGAVVIPQGPNFTPLVVYGGPGFTGSPASLHQYVNYSGPALGGFTSAIHSFVLRRGYMATLAECGRHRHQRELRRPGRRS
jgi:hypothetical protein